MKIKVRLMNYGGSERFAIVTGTRWEVDEKRILNIFSNEEQIATFIVWEAVERMP